MMNTPAQAEALAQRPYLIKTSIEETTDNQPIYFAQVHELAGCFGQGTTHEAAVADLHLAMVDFIESLLEEGLPVPEPKKLINSTMGTGACAGFTFVARDKKFQPKPDEVPIDAWLLSVQIG
jgi:predicted RNase H-like HicB family nuclease